MSNLDALRRFANGSIDLALLPTPVLVFLLSMRIAVMDAISAYVAPRERNVGQEAGLEAWRYACEWLLSGPRLRPVWASLFADSLVRLKASR